MSDPKGEPQPGFAIVSTLNRSPFSQLSQGKCPVRRRAAGVDGMAAAGGLHDLAAACNGGTVSRGRSVVAYARGQAVNRLRSSAI